MPRRRGAVKYHLTDPRRKEEINPAGCNAVEFLKKVRENRSPFPKFGDFLLVCTPAEE